MNETLAIKAFAALAQDSRLQVFRLLVKAGPEGLSAGEIARQLELSPATLSFHLSQLVNAGLLESRRQSRLIIYGLKVDGIRGLLDFLMEDCCQGRPELCSPYSVECCPPVSNEERLTKVK